MAKTKEQTLIALGPLMDEFYEAVTEGVRDQLEKYPDTGHVHRLMTTRQLARDHVVDRLRTRLEGKPGVRIEDENQTTYFRLLAEYQVLAKKVDELGAIRLTGSQGSFDFQSNEQLHLDTDVIPEVVNLYVGYVPNENDPRNPAVLLVRPNKSGADWVHEIPRPDATAVVEEIPTPTPLPSTEVGDLIRIPLQKKTELDSE